MPKALIFILAVVISLPALALELGDPARGADVWKQCMSCHMVGPDAKNRVGPALNELFDRRAASIDGFKYSKSLERAGADGLIWDLVNLNLYIENPKVLVSGTRMNFRGIESAEERADLIAFLRQYSTSPANIPESAPTALPTDPDLDPAVLAMEGDSAYGEYLASECTTCHQVSGTDAGIPSITGWPRDDFVIAMHAYKQKHRPHPVMQMMAGRLSNEEIAGLAAYFEGLQ